LNILQTLVDVKHR